MDDDEFGMALGCGIAVFVAALLFLALMALLVTWDVEIRPP